MKKIILVSLSTLIFTITPVTFKAQIVSSLAGSTSQGTVDASGAAASFSFPMGVCSDSNGNIYIADYNNSSIRKITPSGVVTTFAGSSSGGSADGQGTSATFYRPFGICSDASDNIYVADSYGNKIRKITPSGFVSTIAGSGSIGSLDATGLSATFNSPRGICVDPSGNIYVADYSNHTIRKITTAGIVTTFAGSAGSPGSINGTGTSASFNNPRGVCSDLIGNIYVADRDNHKIRKITPAGVVTTFAGTGFNFGAFDGNGLSASFNFPAAIHSDALGNIYVADDQNHKVRKITPAGFVTTIAGTGTSGSTDGPGPNASFNYLQDVCTDPTGNIYVADRENHTIRKIIPIPIANYSVSVNKCAGSPISFTDRSSCDPTSWDWTFSGPTTILSTSQNPSVTFTAAGTYTTTLISTNSFGSSTAFTNTFVVNPSPTLSVTASSNTVCFGSSITLTVSGATSYTWSTGSNNASISDTPAATTVYTINASIATCTAATTTTIIVNALPTVTVTPTNTTICNGTSITINANGVNSYLWSTGSTSTSITETPTTTSVYSLTATSIDGCTVQATANISVNTLTDITGIASNTLGTVSGRAILYEHKPFLTQFDSILGQTLNGFGAYTFSLVPQGNYIVKVIPTAAGLQVTYGGSEISWQNATVINHGCAANSNQNINVLELTPITIGSNSISGTITEGIGFGQKPSSPSSPLTPGLPIGNALVKAGINPGGNIFSQTLTSSVGTYTFSNIPMNIPGQEYFIMVDIPGIDTSSTYHLIINSPKAINASSTQFNNFDFVVDSMYVNPVGIATSISPENSIFGGEIRLFPNPAKEVAFIEYELTASTNIQIELYDLLGQKVKTIVANSKQEKNNYKHSINLNELNSGIYFVKVKINNSENVIKLIITN